MTSIGSFVNVTAEGKHMTGFDGECILFPSKEQRDWSKWQRPLIDGDILSYQSDYFNKRSIYIYKYHAKMNTSYYVALSGSSDSKLMINYNKSITYALNGYNDTARFATEKEKEQLFQAIKNHGYKWNNITKTLEKLITPKFKVGDIIQDKNNYKVKITEVNIEDELYGYESLIAHGIGGFLFNEQDNWKLAVKYKFKVGDKIRHKDNENILKIDEIDISGSIYCCGSEYVWVVDQDNYELVPNKFDYKTLKPFDKVLVRTHPDNNWFATFFSHINSPETFYYKFATTSGLSYKQCIPYNEETKHLLGTNEQAPEFYIY